jgi:hypothetical protein
MELNLKRHFTHIKIIYNMRLYNVTDGKKKKIVAAHNPHQAGQVSGFKKVEVVEEINIAEPVVVWQESTQTEK